MKGGAVFRTTVTDDELRSSMGMLPENLQGKDVVNLVYRSPLRVLGVQEVTKYNTPGGVAEEEGNLHAMLVTLPETGKDVTVEYIPNIPTNFFKVHTTHYGIVNRVNGEVKYNTAIPGVPSLVDREGVPTRTQSRQIAALESATRQIPEVIQQRIARMAGLTSMVRAQRPLTTTAETAMDAVPLSDTKSALAMAAPQEIQADAIIDAAVAWVKAWNTEHGAPKGSVKAAATARKAAEKGLSDLEEGKTKASVPMPASSSSSSAAPQGGRRKKTNRGSKKRRTTRRRS